MSQRTTRLRGPLAALLIALGVGAVLLVGEVACFSLHLSLIHISEPTRH